AAKGPSTRWPVHGESATRAACRALLSFLATGCVDESLWPGKSNGLSQIQGSI
ncbi:hypothetical protein M514_28042, partial [Trichuris suis]